MPDPIRVALIGCGGIMVGRHLRLMLQHEDATLVAFTDPVAAARQRAREADPTLAAVPTFADHAQMLAEVQPEAVVIGTPHSFHHRHIIDSLHAGAHVLVEKPMVNTAAEAEEVIATRDATGKVVAIAYQRHGEATFRQIKRLIDDGSLGDIQFITAEQDQPWHTVMLQRELPWRVKPELSGGGQLNDSGSHLVDILLHVTGLVPERVFALQQHLTLDVDVNSAIVVQFHGGAIATLAIVGNSPGIQAHVWEDIAFHGSKGTLYYRMIGQPDQRPWLEWRRQGDEAPTPFPTPPAETTPDANFLAAIRGREPVAATAEDGLRVAKLSAAIWQSAQQGKAVTVAS